MAITFTRPGGDGAAAVRTASVAPAGLAAAGEPAGPRDQAGEVLVELYEYLRANAPEHRALASVVPVLSDAVARYRTGTAPDPFDGPRAVLAAVDAARREDPTIPEP